jgi:cell division protein FtsB
MTVNAPLTTIRANNNRHAESILANRALKKEQIQQKRSNLEKTIETSLKIFANVGISLLAILSIKHLLPYHLTQQEKIAEINAEIAKIKPRVEKLQESFGTTFDPKLTRKVMEKNTYKVDPNVSRVFFIKKK